MSADCHRCHGLGTVQAPPTQQASAERRGRYPCVVYVPCPICNNKDAPQT